jgi:hypothetical protein
MARVSCIHKTATSCTPSATIYSTVAAWEASINRASNGDETGVICDDTTYDEATVSINAAVSGTSMIRLTANDGAMFTHIDGSPVGNVRGDGTFRSGARFNKTGTGQTLTIDTDYVIVDHIGFVRNNASTARCVNIAIDSTGTTQLANAIINCTFESLTTDVDQDAIYIGGAYGAMASLLIDGCSFFNFTRCGILRQQTGNTNNTDTDTDTVIVNCGGYSNRNSDLMAAILHLGNNSTGQTFDVTIHNNAGGYHNFSSLRMSAWSDGRHVNKGEPDGPCIWNGSHNFDDGYGFADIDLGPSPGANNTTNWVSGSANPSTVATTQSSGTYWVVEDLTAGTASFIPLDDAAGNAIIGAGVALSSFPSTGDATLDTWWDTVNGTGKYDKRGYARNDSTPDIGPYSFEDHTIGVDIPFIGQGAHIS